MNNHNQYKSQQRLKLDSVGKHASNNAAALFAVPNFHAASRRHTRPSPNYCQTSLLGNALASNYPTAQLGNNLAAFECASCRFEIRSTRPFRPAAERQPLTTTILLPARAVGTPSFLEYPTVQAGNSILLSSSMPFTFSRLGGLSGACRCGYTNTSGTDTTVDVAHLE